MLVSLGALVPLPNALAVELVFTENTIEQLKQEHKGEKWLMVLWSVECPPCLKELSFIAKLLEQNKNLPVVVINTDGDHALDEIRAEIMAQFNLAKLKKYYFSDGQAEVSRFQVDPNWYGELPRSYFINEQGHSIGKSGLLSQVVIKQWLAIDAL